MGGRVHGQLRFSELRLCVCLLKQQEQQTGCWRGVGWCHRAVEKEKEKEQQKKQGEEQAEEAQRQQKELKQKKQMLTASWSRWWGDDSHT